MEAMRRTRGVPYAFQVHQALVAWLDQQEGRRAAQ